MSLNTLETGSSKADDASVDSLFDLITKIKDKQKLFDANVAQGLISESKAFLPSQHVAQLFNAKNTVS